MSEHRTLGGFFLVLHWEKVISGVENGSQPAWNTDQRPMTDQPRRKETVIMNAIMQEATAPNTIVTTREAQSEFSQEYSKGELEEMDSRELLDGYAE